jgi:DNA-binding Xre family transcriptional regulator
MTDVSAGIREGAPQGLPTNGPAAEAPTPFTVAVKAVQLRHQMHVRGMTGAELARRAGISAATVSHALNGRRIHPKKLMAMVMALLRVEPVPGLDALVDIGPSQREPRP